MLFAPTFIRALAAAAIFCTLSAPVLGADPKPDAIVKSKSIRDEEKGVVRWAVYILNQKDEVVATYDLLTMNKP